MIPFKDEDFTKSSYSGYSSGTGSSCVMVAHNDAVVAVRDSKDHQKTTLQFNKMEWTAFIKGVKAGEFDFGV